MGFLDMLGPDPDFNEETASRKEKAQEWWGDPDVNPYTGVPDDNDDD